MLGVSIVVYHSDRARLVATLRALAMQSLRAQAIRIHVNDAGASECPAELAAAAEAVANGVQVVVSSTSDNRGFAGAHNELLRAHLRAGCNAVLICNPDLVLASDAAEALAAASAAVGPVLLGPALELADPVTCEPTGRVDTLGIRWTLTGRHLDDRQGEPMPVLPPEPYRVAGVSGACLYVTQQVHDRIVAATGEFFDDDFIAYREDAELGLRAGLVGVPSYVVPAARGRHARRLRGTSRGSDPNIDRLGVRNRFLLAFKYGRRRPGFAPAVLLRDALVIAGVVVRERSSLPGLREAWRLRHAMRAKRRRLRAVTSSRD